MTVERRPLVNFLSKQKQKGVFPGASVTDARLGTSADNVRTILTQSMLVTDSTFRVLSTAGIAANQIAMVDSENVFICAVDGQRVSVGRSSCLNIDGRVLTAPLSSLIQPPPQTALRVGRGDALRSP